MDKFAGGIYDDVKKILTKMYGGFVDVLNTVFDLSYSIKRMIRDKMRKFGKLPLIGKYLFEETATDKYVKGIIA